MKVFFRRIHLYLGLAAGLIILVTCLTGAILVYEQELKLMVYSKRYTVEPGATRLTISALEDALTKAMPDARLQGVKWYTDPSRSVELMLAGKERTTAYLNPYTGALLDISKGEKDFFFQVMALHRWMLSRTTGKLVVGISTLVFLFILITGIILWWPANKRILLQRLSVKWSAGWKRLNHDWHIVLGFYSAIFLFVFAFTGLAWSFEWFNKGIYKVTNSSMKNDPPPPVDAKTSAIQWDKMIATVSTSAPAIEFGMISQPKDSGQAFAVTVLPVNAVHESASETYFVDPYTAEVLRVRRWTDRNLGQRVRATFKPVHTGAIFGWPSKLIGFLACLLGASFPVTGVILWINRTRKKTARGNA